VERSPHLPTSADLAATYALESVKQFGPQKFREVRDSGLTPTDVLADPTRLPIGGKRGDAFRVEITRLVRRGIGEFEERAARQLDRATHHGVHVLLHGDAAYPANLWASNNPVPVLYVRGELALLQQRRAIACVGSRGIRGDYEARQRDFAAFAAGHGWTVVSGFALGADSTAHRAARDAGGSTVCVMPSGLDRPFPPENKGLWNEFTTYPKAVMVSEFPFGTPAAALTLRKRNKTIVAFSLGVLIGQSSESGGAMNAFRFAIEQRKPVATFAGNGSDDTSGNRKIAAEISGTEFPAGRRDEGAWKAWLQTLSSST